MTRPGIEKHENSTSKNETAISRTPRGACTVRSPHAVVNRSIPKGRAVLSTFIMQLVGMCVWKVRAWVVNLRRDNGLQADVGS